MFICLRIAPVVYEIFIRYSTLINLYQIKLGSVNKDEV